MLERPATAAGGDALGAELVPVLEEDGVVAGEAFADGRTPALAFRGVGIGTFVFMALALTGFVAAGLVALGFFGISDDALLAFPLPLGFGFVASCDSDSGSSSFLSFSLSISSNSEPEES